jgi:predicted RNase H-like HicB family nuclease
MKTGETVWCEVNSFFDIRQVIIEKETSDFFHFRIPEKEKLIRRKKNRFAKTKEELLEKKIEVLDWHLQSLKTNGEEVYKIYKFIYENNPEILI